MRSKRQFPKRRMAKLREGAAARQVAIEDKENYNKQKAEMRLALGEFAMSQLPDDFLEGYGEIADDLRPNKEERAV